MAPSGPFLSCAGRELDLSRPAVMGVVNVTPDSFSDGGAFLAPERAVEHALALVEAGAEVLDVGGESTRPGAEPVEAERELERVVPVLEALRARTDVPLSIDTSKPEVMRQAVSAGAGLINDVRALTEPDALAAAAELAVPVCLMHMQGQPRTMQAEPRYTDVVSQVRAYLAERMEACRDAGIPRERLLVDPGFGFGKTLEHNLALLGNLATIGSLGVPVLVGLSRKSMFGKLLGREVGERLPASVAAAALAVWQGAHIVRAHDVAATVDGVRLAQAARATSR